VGVFKTKKMTKIILQEAPLFCCIELRTTDEKLVLLRSSFHDREFYPLKYWVDVKMYTPYGSQTWKVDIREIVADPESDECPVCMLAVWVNEHTMAELILEIKNQIIV
jgi:hypothetical protein